MPTGRLFVAPNVWDFLWPQTTCQLICNTHLDVGQHFHGSTCGSLWRIFYIFPYPFLFFCEGIKLALGRAAAANKKQKKYKEKKWQI